MAITKNLVVTLKDDIAELKDKMFIFRNDVGVEMIIELKDFEYSIDAIGNKNNFSKVSAIFRTPSGKLYSYNDIKVSSGKIRFVFTQDLINVMQEIGEYELQFQLYDKLNNRLTIPSYNFYVKEPLCLPNEAIVGEGRVGFSYVAEDETYLFSIENGYIKTEWEVGDLITKGKLNKIENAIFDVVNVINNMDTTNNNPNPGNQHTHNNMGVLNTITADKINQWDNKSDFDGNYNNLINKPPIPTEISDLINDVGYLTSIPNEYVTDSELNNKGYLTEHQDISGKVDKISGYSLVSDAEIDRLATLENYDDTNLNIALDNLTNAINKTQIDKSTIPTKTSDLINDVGYLTSIPSEYVTDSELNSKGYLTEHQDISGKVDKVNGYSLVSDSEISRLATLKNYNDTEVRDLINETNTSLDKIAQQINKIEVLESDPTGNELYEGRIWISKSLLPAEKPCSSISLNSSSLAFTNSTPQILTPTVSPTDTTDVVVWSVSPNGIVTVNNGVVTPISNGTCTITATCGNCTTTCSVNVNIVIVQVSGVTLNKSTITINQGTTETLIATVSPDNANNKAITWSSSNNNIATVDNGVVTGVSSGNCDITVKTVDGNKTATCSVTVQQASAIENNLYIRLDNTTAQTDTSWVDGSGKGNDFTYSEATSDTTCGFNDSKALVFNGTNNAMLFIDSYFVGTIHEHKKADITIEIEFKFTDISKERYLLGVPSWDNGICFGVKSSKFVLAGNPSLNIDCGTADTNKHIFTFVCGSTGTVIYKDGAKLTEGGKVNIKDTNKICIGKSHTQASSQLFAGELYSFRAYNKILSESEVVARHNEAK